MTAILDRVRSDEHLARRAIGGDVPAFDELVRRYRPGLSAYGARLLGDREGGEDVAQIALFNAYRALQRGTRPRNLQAWLYRIARNAAYEVARRRRELPVAEDAAEPVEDLQESTAIRGVLLEGLRDLPDRQRRTFLLRELHGYSSAETADELELTVPQVEQALFAARNRLAERLVFGGRIDCEQLRELDPSSLDLAQRRALKAHSRSCPSCRSSLRRTALGAVAVPLTLVASAREALAFALGGALSGAPVAAKVGAAVVTAAVATSVPVAVRVDGAPDRSSAARVETVAEPGPGEAAGTPPVSAQVPADEPAPPPPAVAEPLPVAPADGTQLESPTEPEVAEPPELPGVVQEPAPGETEELSGSETSGSEQAAGPETDAPGDPSTGEPAEPAEPIDVGDTGAELLGADAETGIVSDVPADELDSDGPPCVEEACATTEPATPDPA